VSEAENGVESEESEESEEIEGSRNIFSDERLFFAASLTCSASDIDVRRNRK